MTLSQHSTFSHQTTTAPEWQTVLDPGEPLLWQGRPSAGLNFTLAHALRLLRSAVMLSLFVYLVHNVSYGIANSRDVQVIVVLVFFLPVPLDLIKSMITRRMQRYAFTPCRAIIATRLGPFGRSIRSIPIIAATPLTLLRSSILFSESPHWYTGLITSAPTAGFERIADAEAVFALMRHTQKGAS